MKRKIILAAINSVYPYASPATRTKRELGQAVVKNNDTRVARNKALLNAISRSASRYSSAP